MCSLKVQDGPTPLEMGNHFGNERQRTRKMHAGRHPRCCFCGRRDSVEPLPDELRLSFLDHEMWCRHCRASYSRGQEQLQILKAKVANCTLSASSDFELFVKLNRELVSPHELLEVVHTSQDCRDSEDPSRVHWKKNHNKVAVSFLFLLMFGWDERCRLVRMEGRKRPLWRVHWGEEVAYHVPEDAFPEHARRAFGMRGCSCSFCRKHYGWIKPIVRDLVLKRNYAPLVSV